MLVKLQGVWRDHPIWVNQAHVKTLRPNVVTEGNYGERRTFCVAGQTLIEYAVDAGDGELFTASVWGSMDDIAAKLNVEAGNG